MNDYEITNLIINFFTAIGTCGAVIVALYLARPKKEKAEGCFKIQFYDNSSSRATINFSICNIGNKNIKLDCKIGACLKLNDINEYIRIVSNYDDLYIPTKAKKYCKISVSFRERNIAEDVYSNKKNIEEIYRNNNSILCLYT
ncbi:MAG: hypothetical protein PHH62_05470, partial [Endomicrobiaceae bacterium]|nr:hypothetical protein [Endomicrobiaceae bacterium]